MPPPRKIDLLPDDLRVRLAQALSARGFGDIVEVTEELNFWLEDAGLELTLGKSAVGEYAKLLKQQRSALSMARALVSDMDLDGESDMQRLLMQMITTAAVQMMQSVAEDDEASLDPKGLASLAKMLKDLMHSTGLREKLLADERKRVVEEARAAAQAEAVEALEGGVAKGDITREAMEQARQLMGFA